MAGLIKVGDYFYAVFSVTIAGKRKKRKISLRTKNRRQANEDIKILTAAEIRGDLNPLEKDFNVQDFIKRKTRYYGLTIEECIPLFLDDHPNWSPKTRLQYETILNGWYHMMKGTLVMAETKNDALTFLNQNQITPYLLRPGIKNPTRKKELRHIKRFCNWLVEVHASKRFDTRATFNPCKGIKLPEEDIDYHSKMLSDDELNRIIEAYHLSCNRSKKPGRTSYVRPWFPMLMRMYHYTGCRRSELLDRQLKHLDGLEFITVVGKRSRIRKVFLKSELQEYLKEYVSTLPTNDREQYLFPNEFSGKPINGDQVFYAFSKYRKLAKVPDSRTIHGMRHNSVTEDLKAGVSLTMVQKQHGHTSSKVTEIYEHLAASDLKDAYKKM